MDLTGKTALVTGAARGIGFGCAKQMAVAGADIVLNDRPGSEFLTEAAEEIRALGRKCTPIEANVFDRDGCEGLVAEAVSQAGKLDILLSNPAFNRRQNFLEHDPEEFKTTLDAALLGGFHMAQFTARHFAERGEGGKIVFISSVLAQVPVARSLAYSAAKSALNSMTRSMAVELFDQKINVNAIAPGWIDTPGERDSFAEETIEEEAQKLPWKRLGTIEDIGNAAAFLVSDAADYITGVVLNVDGGYVLKHCREIPKDTK
ncbi:MAG: SDR family oxidoreductase [Verrucomicrobiales bacterium]|nr:SDR family oxidoreductase [Verrucomicrobiales bacterium]